MTTARELVGQWQGEMMVAPGARSYEVLMFHQDGTGFLDLYYNGSGFGEQFRWSVEPSAGLRLEGSRLMQLDPEHGTHTELATTLDTVVPFSVAEEDIGTRERMRVLRFAIRPWPGMSDCYRFYRMDLPMYATFVAPCFVLKEGEADAIFRGQALSDYLARQLKARRIAVGPRRKVYFGACYYRVVKMQGRELGLAVNAEEDAEGWWLRIDRPAEDGTALLVELHRLLDDILRGVPGLHSLRWQTEEEWRQDPLPPTDEPRPGSEP